MTAKTLLLAAVAALTTAACSQEKTADTAGTTQTTTATTTTTTTVDTAAYRDEANRMADRIAQDLKLGPETVTRIRTVYYTRGRTLNRYTADTTGRYAATKAANDATNREMRGILTEPAQYNTYTSNMGTYYAGQPYTVVVLEPAHRAGMAEEVSGGTMVKKMERQNDGDKKTKFENGAKIKRNDDGSKKIKLADGTKILIDENGKRTVK